MYVEMYLSGTNSIISLTCSLRQCMQMTHSACASMLWVSVFYSRSCDSTKVSRYLYWTCRKRRGIRNLGPQTRYRESKANWATMSRR